MISHDESKRLLAKLRSLFTEIAAGPPAARLAELGHDIIDVGGDLFDAHYLDGQQYHEIYELSEAIKSGKPTATIKEHAEICLAICA